MRRRPSPLPYAEAGLSDEAAAAHALNRLAFGPRPGEVAAVASRGVEAWIAEQLAPPDRDRDLDDRLTAFDALTWTTEEVVARHPSPADAIRQAAAEGVVSEGAVRKDPGVRQRLFDWMERNGLRRPPDLARDLLQAKLTRAVHAKAQLREVLADFWYNHFNVNGRGTTLLYIPTYERDAIRPHVLGSFREMLGATARHPAMLAYLDNASSRAASGTPVTTGRAPRRGGLNENYGRELLELHTLGVDGGYTQADVVATARAFTGWTIYPLRGGADALARQQAAIDQQLSRGAPVVRDGLFLFRPNWHDAEPKTILGRSFPGGRGIEDGEAVLDLLAAHESTARHLAYKLAVRFVEDDPDEQLVGRLAEVYRRTDGDLGEVMAALVRERAFWDAARSGPDGAPSKVKTPFEYVASAARATAAPIRSWRGLLAPLREMGEPPYYAEPPTGFPDHAAAWVNAGLLLTRMNLGLQLAAGRVRGARPDLDALTDGRQPESVDAALQTYVAALLPGRDPAPTVRLLGPIVREPAFARRVTEAATEAEAETPLAAEDDDVFAEAAEAPFDPDDTAAFVVGVVLGSPAFQRQ